MSIIKTVKTILAMLYHVLQLYVLLKKGLVPLKLEQFIQAYRY